MSTTASGEPRDRVVGTASLGSALRMGRGAYAAEAVGLAGFLLVVGIVDSVVFAPESPVSGAIGSDWVKRAIVGVSAGLYLIALVYSPVGKESGAHINPSITLAFLRLRKIDSLHAGLYIAAQFVGAVAGVLVYAALMGSWASAPDVEDIVTQPGQWGWAAAFVAELCITFSMMLLVLESSNRPRFARLTGLFSGVWLALLILFESPVSGTSLNPARSTGSAVVAGGWFHLALYFIAPPIGAQLAITAYRRGNKARPVGCAKLHHHHPDHPGTARCIMRDCGYKPPA